MRSFAASIVFFAASTAWAGTTVKTPGAGAASEVEVKSPNGKVAMTVFVTARQQLGYEVRLGDAVVVEASNMGLKVDGVDLGTGAALAKSERFQIDEKYPYRGVHSEAINRCNGAKIEVARGKDPGYTVEVRVFDDAAAFRFIVPGTGARVPDAGTTFRIPAGATAWHHGLDGHYEDVWTKSLAQEIPAGTWVAPPLTFKLPGGGYAAIHEADLRSYAGMALEADGQRGFREVLAHAQPVARTFQYGAETAERLKKPAAIDGVITTPWRVVITGADLDTMVNSDAIPNLCPPPNPALFPEGIKTAWIKPGRAVWRYVEREENLVPDPKAESPEEVRRLRDLAEIREYSRLAGELGFEYQVIEGMWRRWTRDERRDLVRYSKERGVGLWFWIHSRTMFDAERRRALFEELSQDGIVGLKIDFFDHEAKEWIDLYQAILRDAAQNKLMINFHGSNKTAGEPRTWPNEMTRESIKGMESRRVPAWGPHNTTWPFTRLLVGHAEFTPIVFGERRRETSWSHQIASAVVLTAPLLTVSARPTDMLNSPASDVIKSIPATWDQTVVLPPSEIGDLAIFARRTGDKWFIAGLNNELVKELKLATPFLEKGRRYELTLVKDLVGVTAPADKVELETRDFTAGDTLAVTVRGGGGFVARLTPQ